MPVRLSRLAGDRAILRVQGPVVLGRRSEPEPDLTILKPPLERYAAAHPQAEDILLVIEVSDTTVEYDRTVKLPLYAGMGIPEVWLVNLAADRIEADRYATIRLVSRGDTLSPLYQPSVTLAADDILGPPKP